MNKKILAVAVCLLTLCGCTSASPLKGDETIYTETVVVPELKNTYKFFFVTDQHISLSEKKATEEELTSAEQFSKWIAYTNYDPDISALLLSGDILSFPSPENIAYAETELAKLEKPYLYTLGNHDWNYADDYMTPNAFEKNLPLFDKLVGTNTAINYMDFEEIRIISINDSTGQVDPKVLDSYSTLLDTDKKVILVMHVPLVTQSVLGRAREVWSSPTVLGAGNYGGIYPNEVSSQFIELTSGDTSPVIAVLAGHVHFHDRDMLNDNAIQIVGPTGYSNSAVVLELKGE